MLESTKIQKRQSEIRQELATLAGKENPEENELRSMTELDREYGRNEIRYRASLVSEDQERREAGVELETREDIQRHDLYAGFQVRQAIGYLQDGSALTGQTLEAEQELRSQRSYDGIAVPLEALLGPMERRAGETTSATVPSPTRTNAPIDLLYAQTVATAMGVSFLNIGSGLQEWPIGAQGCQVGWANGETGAVGTPREIQMNNSVLSPDQMLGAQLTITRKALAQSGQALEQFARRDLRAAITQEVDRAIFIGSGVDGELAGLLAGSYGLTSTGIDAAASYSNLRDVASKFLSDNAAGDHSAVRLLFRQEVADALDDDLLTGTATSTLDRLRAKLGRLVSTSSALAAPTGGPPATSSALMTVGSNGVPPAIFASWGAIDLVRDNITGAASGLLTLTALMTCDLAVTRPQQTRILTGIE